MLGGSSIHYYMQIIRRRPRMRCKDVIKKDVEHLGICSNWRNIALNSECWRIGLFN